MFIAKKFVKEMNNLVKQTKERHLAKKKRNIARRSIFKFFYCEGFLTKKNVPQKEFLPDLGLLIVKNNLTIQFLESIWLKQLTL